MKNIKLDHDVQIEVLTYLSKIHKRIDQRKDLDQLISKLSPSLKNLVTKRLFLNVISVNQVFENFPEVFEFILENIEAR